MIVATGGGQGRWKGTTPAARGEGRACQSARTHAGLEARQGVLGVAAAPARPGCRPRRRGARIPEAPRRTRLAAPGTRTRLVPPGAAGGRPPRHRESGRALPPRRRRVADGDLEGACLPHPGHVPVAEAIEVSGAHRVHRLAAEAAEGRLDVLRLGAAAFASARGAPSSARSGVEHVLRVRAEVGNADGALVGERQAPP